MRERPPRNVRPRPRRQSLEPRLRHQRRKPRSLRLHVQMRADHAALKPGLAGMRRRLGERLEQIEPALIAMHHKLRLVGEVVIERALRRPERLANLIERRAVDTLPVEQLRRRHRNLLDLHRLRIAPVEHVRGPRPERLDVDRTAHRNRRIARPIPDRADRASPPPRAAGNCAPSAPCRPSNPATTAPTTPTPSPSARRDRDRTRECSCRQSLRRRSAAAPP